MRIYFSGCVQLIFSSVNFCNKKMCFRLPTRSKVLKNTSNPLPSSEFVTSLLYLLRLSKSKIVPFSFCLQIDFSLTGIRLRNFSNTNSKWRVSNWHHLKTQLLTKAAGDNPSINLHWWVAGVVIFKRMLAISILTLKYSWTTYASAYVEIIDINAPAVHGNLSVKSKWGNSGMWKFYNCQTGHFGQITS